MNDNKNNSVSIEEIMGKINAEIEKTGKNPGFTPQNIQEKPSEISQPSLNQAMLTRKSYKIDELLQYHDEEFVRNCYRLLLKREADENGLTNHLANLRNLKRKKEEIIAALLYSNEGKSRGVSVSGLKKKYYAAKIKRILFSIPVIGYIIQLFVFLAGLPLAIKNIQKFQNFLLSRTGQNAEKLELIRQNFNFFTGEHGNFQQSVENFANQHNNFKHSVEFFIKNVIGQMELIKYNAERLDNLHLNLNSFTGQQTDFKQSIEQFIMKFNEQLSGTERRIGQTNEKLGRTEVRIDETNAKLARTETRIDDTNAKIANTETRIDDTNAKIANNEARISMSDTKTDELHKQIRDQKMLLLDQQRRLMLLLEEARKRLPQPISEKQIETMLTEEEHMMDAMYVLFEDQHRGTREDIKNRQKNYLSYLKKAGAGLKDSMIIDVGCGRGEWLELLKDNKLSAKGVDLNRIMIEQAKEFGLDVELGDAIEFLSKLKANSIGAVTGFHILEHLPLKSLIRLLDESLRVLKPEGIIIFETPNPENIIVGSCNFYMDMTHRNPIVPQSLQFLVEQRGFISPEILRSSPLNYVKYDKDDAIKHIAYRFNMEQDYAVIARKS